MPPLRPTTNADGQPVPPMTDEQKYLFDLKGWLLFPGLLNDAQLAPIREHLLRFMADKASLPEEQRDVFGGAAQVLLDHPVIVSVLNEILSHQTVASEELYGFRIDHSALFHRKPGSDTFNPHGGGGLVNFAGNSHHYQIMPGKIFSGLTRVVWEINGVPAGGGTMLLSGSHKTAFPRPESLSGRDSALWEKYTCPPGSLLIFTESLCHTGTLWESEVERLATFTCYNTMGSRWGRGTPPTKVIEAMPPKRRSLFRSVWIGFGDGKDFSNLKDYSETNKAD
ncbi:MAG: hypothetical protein NTW19_09475 [Planctomycetota bacterium]|nr:hypothetical protein [Planctomycetota bacterium]